MKYIHIVQFHLMSGGGVGSVITDLCEAMAKRCSEVYAISLFHREGIDFNEELEWAKDVGIHAIMAQKDEKESVWGTLRNLRRIIKDLAQDDSCCLFLHLKWGVLAGILSTLCLRNISRIEVYHSGYMGYRLQAFWSKPFLAHYIAVSKDAKRQLMEWFHVKENMIDVVYNGVDVSLIREIASGVNPPSEKLVFVSVGRLSFEKGFKTSIEAYTELRKEGHLSGSSYTMIGDGVQRKECEAFSYGIVDYTGVIERKQVYRIIGSASVMILPSLWEGNSILMLEVMALGRPMVLTDIPAFREILEFKPLQDNETCRLEWFGVVFRKDDINSCKEALLLAECNQGLYQDMSRRIYEMGSKFSTENQARQYFQIACK